MYSISYNFKIVPCFYVFTLLPFQGVNVTFLFHIPRAPLRLPWAMRFIGLSARAQPLHPRTISVEPLILKSFLFDYNLRQLAVNERQCFLRGLLYQVIFSCHQSLYETPRKSSHTIWCERSHQMVWALVSYGVSAHIKWCEMTWNGLDGTLQALEGGYIVKQKWFERISSPHMIRICLGVLCTRGFYINSYCRHV